MFFMNLWRSAIKSTSQEVLFIAKNTSVTPYLLRDDVLQSTSLSSDGMHQTIDV